MSKKTKYILILLLIVSLLLLSLSFFYLQNFLRNNSCNLKVYNNALENLNSITNSDFYIDKILYFNNANLEGENLESSGSRTIYQYCDIALFLSNIQNNQTSKNTLKSLCIDNLQITQKPILGSPIFARKNIEDFSKASYNINNTFTNKLDFKVSDVDLESNDSPYIYNNLSSPIIFSYINRNIKTINISEYPNEKILYNGSLLKTFNIPLSSLSCSFSFDIILENILGNKYIAHINSSIPLRNFSDDTNSLYNGTLTYLDNNKIYFSNYN